MVSFAVAIPHTLLVWCRLHAKPEQVRRGMMRQLFVIIDQSACMDESDLKPTRLDLVKTVCPCCRAALCCVAHAQPSPTSPQQVERFIREYFDQNPISQLGLIGTKNGRSDRISDLSGNVGQHLDDLREQVTLKRLGGQPSIQNAIELARQILKYVPARSRGEWLAFGSVGGHWDRRGLPPHASREVVMILGSLTTSDPGNIFKTIDECKKDNVMGVCMWPMLFCCVGGLATMATLALRSFNHWTSGGNQGLRDDM